MVFDIRYYDANCLRLYPRGRHLMASCIPTQSPRTGEFLGRGLRFRRRPSPWSCRGAMKMALMSLPKGNGMIRRFAIVDRS